MLFNNKSMCSLIIGSKTATHLFPIKFETMMMTQLDDVVVNIAKHVLTCSITIPIFLITSSDFP
jgi:Na+-translocating ferredoxin:NAD+ oxidoreductase RnfE subunit